MAFKDIITSNADHEAAFFSEGELSAQESDEVGLTILYMEDQATKRRNSTLREVLNLLNPTPG